MRFKRLGIIGAFATACIIGGTFATYSIRAQPSGGGDSSLGFNCPLSTSAFAQNSLCVTVSIPQGAAGKGTAAFGVNPLSVGLGATVIWWNQDSVPHTVTADDGSFDSGPIAPGQYFAHTFNAPGTKTYYCKIHGRQAMSGAVSVSSTPATPVGCPVITPSPSTTPAADCNSLRNEVFARAQSLTPSDTGFCNADSDCQEWGPAIPDGMSGACSAPCWAATVSQGQAWKNTVENDPQEQSLCQQAHSLPGCGWGVACGRAFCGADHACHSGPLTPRPSPSPSLQPSATPT